MHSDLEAMLLGGQYHMVLEYAEASFAAELTDEQAVWVATRGCQAAGALRWWQKAVLWSDRGLRLSPADREANALLHLLSGTARMYTGDLYRSERELLRVLTWAETDPQLQRLTGDALFNLGYLMRLLRRPEQEARFFRQAAEVYEAQGRHHRASVCRYEIAWSYLMEPRPELALAELSALNADADLSVDLMIARGLYHCLVNEVGESERLVAPLLQGGDLPARQRADAAWIMGCNACARRDWLAAERYADEAMEAALDDWWAPQVERVHALKKRLLENRVGR